MDERVIDLSEEAVGLHIKYDQLLLHGETNETSIPVDEVAVLVVSHPAVHYSHAALAALCESGSAIILCNSRRLPVGALLPLTGNAIQTERFAAQASSTLPTRKNIWRQIVKSKLLAQRSLLIEANGSDEGLKRMAQRVRSGDPDNLEAQASRRYWPALFGPDFRRVPQADDPVNRCLNYGYAVLRAVVCRAICAAGLHPSLGVHHHNRYDAFCLANDIMEPFRPTVDGLCLKLLERDDCELPLDRQTKTVLLRGLMDARFVIGKEERGLFDTVSRVAVSLVKIFTGQGKKLVLPSWNGKA